MNRYFIKILLLSVLLFSLVGIIFLQQQKINALLSKKAAKVTPVPSATSPAEASAEAWQTYTNATLGIQFDYPPAQKIQDFDSRVTLPLSPSDERQIVGICPAWISFGPSDPNENYKRFPSIVPTKLNNLTIETSNKVDSNECFSKIIYIPASKTPKLIIEIQYPQSDSVISNTISQILSTFHFIN